MAIVQMQMASEKGRLKGDGIVKLPCCLAHRKTPASPA